MILGRLESAPTVVRPSNRAGQTDREHLQLLPDMLSHSHLLAEAEVGCDLVGEVRVGSVQESGCYPNRCETHGLYQMKRKATFVLLEISR